MRLRCYSKKVSLGRKVFAKEEFGFSPQALESAKSSLIRKHCERSQRILQSYREGADFGDAHYRHHLVQLTLGTRMRLWRIVNRYGVPPASARCLQQSIVQCALLYATELMWNGRVGMDGEIGRRLTAWEEQPWECSNQPHSEQLWQRAALHRRGPC